MGGSKELATLVIESENFQQMRIRFKLFLNSHKNFYWIINFFLFTKQLGGLGLFVGHYFLVNN